MSGRNTNPSVAAASNSPIQRSTRQIRGPQSALTDFLAAHNINANQIREDAHARRAAAQTTHQNLDDDDVADALSPRPELPPANYRKESKAQSVKRKKEEEKAIAKIKASRAFERRRRQYGSGSEVSDEDDAARAIWEKVMAPIPGQMENCEICNKRFNVTSYSRAGPNGGLLCPKCTKDIEKEDGSARKKRKSAAGKARRQLQSDLLDGIYPGAKALMTLCIDTLAQNVDQAESLGDLPAPLVDRLSSILSKKRLMSSQTLDLFLRPGADTVTVYDGARLTFDDYIRIFQIVPTLRHLRLRNAVQFKNKVMEHLLGTTVKLETFDIHGANLIDDDRWNRFIIAKGPHLSAFKIHHTDGHFGDKQLELLAKTCPDLKRLKVSHNQQVTDEGIKQIAKLTNLQHLSLEVYKSTTSAPYVGILNNLGIGLRTFSIEVVNKIGDDVLAALRSNCQNLKKLRITDNEALTDAGFASLFTDWINPPLTYIDLHKCRHVDAARPRENPEGIGLCSLGFAALMAHSGSSLSHLNIHSCRHISMSTFEEVFRLGQVYPELETMDLSFCQAVNDFVCSLIFRATPKLKTLKVFGNFGVRDVRVPRGVILIGVPNALGMQIEGIEDIDGRLV